MKNALEKFLDDVLWNIQEIVECSSVIYGLKNKDEEVLIKFERERLIWVERYYGILSLRECIREGKIGDSLAKKSLDWMFDENALDIEDKLICIEYCQQFAGKCDVELYKLLLSHRQEHYYELISIRENVFA